MAVKGAHMEPLWGMIVLFPYKFTPIGWARCDGQLLPIMSNQALFSLLGTQFGGDGQTTFGLPKLAGPASGLNYYIATQGLYPDRE